MLPKSVDLSLEFIYFYTYMCLLSRNSKLYTSRDVLTGDIVLQFYRVSHLKYTIIIIA